MYINFVHALLIRIRLINPILNGVPSTNLQIKLFSFYYIKFRSSYISNCGGLFWQDWAASCGNGLGCLLRWWALVFLSKGAGAGLIATQLGPVCAQNYATPARSKFTASRNRSRQAMIGKLWQARLLQTSYGRQI